MSQSKPVIIAIDDEPPVLQAVQRDLRARYAPDYRIVGAASGQEAIDTIRELALRDAPLALVLADQRMPGVTGVDVLRESLECFPTAKKALLTAYADTDAAISAINDVGLDHYIMKPWSPPEERLYPILDDLLDDWQAGFRPGFEGLRVVSHEWSGPAHDLKVFLATNQIPYQWVVVGRDDRADALVDAAGAGPADLPLVTFPDGDPLLRATPSRVAQRLGLATTPRSTAYDVAIVGAGPAGLAAAVYGASEGLRTLLVESDAPGGQAGQSALIENYLGFPKGITGADLARRAHTQAARFETEILVPATVERVERKDPFVVLHMADGAELTAKALVVASGVSYRRLPADGVDELTGAGVYYGSSRIEATQHAGQPVFVVGGGNSAGQSALFLGRYTDRVTILIRDQDLQHTMSQYLIDNIEADDAVTVVPQTQVVAARGDGHLEHLVLEDLDTGDVREVEAGALFVFIGQEPRTDWLGDLLQVDEQGFVLTGADLGPLKGWNVERDPLPLETSVPGIFAAGDVRHGSIRRVAGATGEGATAIRFVHRHLAAL